ncbi:hypothetical protein SDC9_200557 [bioreactor metagenome]|uniref:Uncharacterized protein n=1 Tax=bioreactor metagenome TaxID=1076179 RepID=A0A645IWZ6_9ZZZZ
MADKRKFTYEVLQNLMHAKKASILVEAESSKRVITESDINGLKDGQELILSKGDIITPLAKDRLKQRKITLIVK